MSEQSKEAREAQEVWAENSAKAAAVNPFGGSYNYYKGIREYKQAFTKMLQDRIKANEANRDKELEGTIPYWAGELILQEDQAILELIETCNP